MLLDYKKDIYMISINKILSVLHSLTQILQNIKKSAGVVGLDSKIQSIAWEVLPPGEWLAGENPNLITPFLNLFLRPYPALVTQWFSKLKENKLYFHNK